MILVASYSAALGGAERLLVEFVSALDGEPWVACPDGPLAQLARGAGLRVVPLHSRSLALRRAPVSAAGALAAHALELRRLVDALAPELVIAWGMRSALAGMLARVPAPVVFQHNDLRPGAAVGAAVRAAAARAALVVALSDAIARDLDPRGALASRLRVIRPGIDVTAFDAVAARAPDDPPAVLVLGALVGWKRPDLALEACALVRRHRPDVRLRFVGAPLASEDGVPAALLSRASAPDLAGAVQFAGAVADVRPELARASCLLHCAEREPFGLAVLEAMAAGRPAVVPARDGPAEIADPSCAVLYPPGDARAAAEALERVLGDPATRDRLGAAGRARARSHFSREAARAQWRGSVEALVPPRSPPRRLPAVAIVTVTHNSADCLAGLLASVDRHLPGVRVLVVDCASEDASREAARDRSDVVVIELRENVGFGRACNRGVAEVREPITVLLNPDVELIDDSVLRLAAQALREPGGERLLAPLVLNPDGSRQDTVHPPPASAPDLVRSLLSPSVVPLPALAPWHARRPRRVGWAVGCALVARTGTLQRLGPFDERLFLYGEDLDLGLRAAAAGIETWFCPDARVVHHRAHSTAAAFGGEPFDRLAAARREVIGRRLGPRGLGLDDAAQALTFGSRLAVKRALGRPAERERRQLEALRRVRR